MSVTLPSEMPASQLNDFLMGLFLLGYFLEDFHEAECPSRQTQINGVLRVGENRPLERGRTAN